MFVSDYPCLLCMFMYLQYRIRLAILCPQFERALLPPPLVALEDTFGFMRAQVIYALTKFGIADLVAEKPRSAEDLAKALSLPEPRKLYRVLRAAESFGYFHEDSDGLWHNTILTTVLTASHPNSVASLVKHLKEDCYTPWSKTLDVVKSDGPGDEIFKSLHDGKSFWEYLQENPAQLKQYREARASLKSFEGYGPVHDFAWSGFKRVIHLGASDGSFLSGLLEAHPHLAGIAFDLPAVIETTTTPAIGDLPKDRLSLVAGDFFEASSLPTAEDGDAYVLYNTLPNWADEPAVQILKNVRSAIGSKNATLVVIEAVPKPNDATATRQLLDVHAMVLLGGKERNPVEFRAILKASGFALAAVKELRSINRAVVATPV